VTVVRNHYVLFTRRRCVPSESAEWIWMVNIQGCNMQYCPISESSPRAATLKYNSTFHGTSYCDVVQWLTCALVYIYVWTYILFSVLCYDFQFETIRAPQNCCLKFSCGGARTHFSESKVFIRGRVLRYEEKIIWYGNMGIWRKRKYTSENLF
jgi:hypothetical protein